MINFSFINPTRIIQGKDIEGKVGHQVAKYSQNVLLHFGEASAQKSGLLQKVRDSLSAAGVNFTELGGVKPNPRAALVYEGVELCKKNGIDFILAVGGGSVIDSAKAIALGAAYDGDFYDFYCEAEHKKTPTAAIKVATVLTMPGAGSESSTGSVITNEEKGTKTSCDGELLFPVFSFLVPDYTRAIPLYTTMCGLFDAYMHLHERYFSEYESETTDRVIEGLMKAAIVNAGRVKAEPDSYDVRADVMLTCKMAHDNWAGMARGGDWSSHCIEHELSQVYDVAHGAGLAVVGPAWMKWAIKCGKSYKICQLGQRVFDMQQGLLSDEQFAYAVVAELEKLITEIGLPTRMGELCTAGEVEFVSMAANCVRNNGEPIGDYNKLTKDDIAEIYRLTV